MIEIFLWLGWSIAGLGWWAFTKECEESRYWERAARELHNELEEYCDHVGQERAALRLVK